MSEKLPKLLALLEKEPNDPFLLYGIGIEYKNIKDYPQAISFLERVNSADPNYCYAYFQRGQVYELIGDLRAAKNAYADGISAAQRSGDAHALGEIEGALSMLD